jgi:hypothetical protein
MTWQSMPVGDLIGEWNIDKTHQGVKKKQAERLFLYRLSLRQPSGKRDSDVSTGIQVA